MNKDILLEKHIQNELSNSEQKAFKQLLKEDLVFAQKVAFQNDLKKSIQYQEQENFKELIGAIESEHKVIPLKKKFTLSKKWLIAASIALLLGLTFVLNNKQTYKPEVLFAANFTPYKNVIYPINRGVNNEKLQNKKAKAFIAYEDGDYKKAVQLFSELYKESKASYYLFYKANALLKLGDSQQAIINLKQHLKTKDSLTEKSNWYLALAYLKEKEIANAKKVLKTISSKKGYNSKKAQKLLQKLQ
jgi:predicted Zn-dependent protease